MTEEMRKRLEEDADNHVGYHFSPNERPEISSVRTAFYAGAVHGYKEAIAQAKEWLSETSIKKYLYDSDGRRWFNTTKFIADFESDMNKLWEGEKNVSD